MKVSLTIFALLAYSCWLNAQALIAVQHGGHSTFFSEIEPALNAAMDGDTIYLPGTGYPNGIIINKPLHIIGAGYHPDSTLATGATMVFGVFVQNGASGGSITGVFISNTLGFAYDPSGNWGIQNYTISRCYLDQGIVFGGPSTQNAPPNKARNITIRECIIGKQAGGSYPNFSIQSNGGIGGTSTSNILVTNNIILGKVESFSQCEFSNNVFLLPSNNTLQVLSTLVRNNIFLTNQASCNVQSSNFYSNLNSGVNGFNVACNNQGAGNYLNTPPVFVQYSGAGFSFSDDFHLVGNFPGTDGTPVGIYGGLYPWKAGGVPYNPHIRTKNIATSTNAQGLLNVQVKVAAQGN